MKKIYKVFILLLIVFIFCCIEKVVLADESFFNKIVFGSVTSSEKNNEILKEISRIMANKDTNNVLSLLNYDTKDSEVLVSNNGKEEIEKALPLIYIYNTHDKEGYVNPNKELYNVEANVRTAAYILQEQLKLYGINSIVEEKSPTSYVSKNKEEYKETYSYSREFALEAQKTYPSLVYFIDLHRDGVAKSISTTTINDKSYAKLMFFLGMNHDQSDQNYALVKDLEAYIENKYDTLLRNTFIRENDAYNQDISPNAFLIEVGGQDNTIDEVYNSLTVFAEALAAHIRGKNG